MIRRALALTSLLVLAACRSTGAPQGSPSTPPTTTPPTASSSTTLPVRAADEFVLWAMIDEQVPGDVISDVIVDGKQRWGVTANGDVATVWDFDGSAWGRSTRVPLDLPANDLDSDLGEIVTTDLTGDGIDDAVVPLLGNGAFGTVLSNHDGDWNGVGFQMHDLVATAMENLGVEGRDLVTYENVCDPSCAEGAADEVTWTFDPSKSLFQERSRIEIAPAAAPTSTTAPAIDQQTDASSDPLAAERFPLHRGSFGPWVGELQRLLLLAGYGVGPEGVDGEFGPATERTVILFQWERGFPENGIVDASLFEVIRAQAACPVCGAD